MERVASEDYDDREARLAHGFSYEDDWTDRSLLCRNGCSESYYDIVGGKMTRCSAAPD